VPLAYLSMLLGPPATRGRRPCPLAPSALSALAPRLRASLGDGRWQFEAEVADTTASLLALRVGEPLVVEGGAPEPSVAHMSNTTAPLPRRQSVPRATSTTFSHQVAHLPGSRAVHSMHGSRLSNCRLEKLGRRIFQLKQLLTRDFWRRGRPSPSNSLAFAIVRDLEEIRGITPPS
jgi:hypothetical protein